MHLDAGNFESHCDLQLTGSSVLGVKVGATVGAFVVGGTVVAPTGWFVATPVAFKSLKLNFNPFYCSTVNMINRP